MTGSKARLHSPCLAGKKPSVRRAQLAPHRLEPPLGADWRLKERVVLVMFEVFEPPTGGSKAAPPQPSGNRAAVAAARTARTARSAASRTAPLRGGWGGETEADGGTPAEAGGSLGAAGGAACWRVRWCAATTLTGPAEGTVPDGFTYRSEALFKAPLRGECGGCQVRTKRWHSCQGRGQPGGHS